MTYIRNIWFYFFTYAKVKKCTEKTLHNILQRLI